MDTGVLQGDTLRHFLFNAVLDFVLSRSIDLREWWVTIRDWDRTGVADNIALLDEDLGIGERHLTKLFTQASKVAWNVIIKKTKYITLNLHDVTDTLQTLDSNMIERIENAKYPRARVVSSRTDLLNRRGTAWSVFWILDKVWRSSELSLLLKLRLFDYLILSVLLYGAETWTIGTEMKQKLDSFGTSCYRMMLGVKKTDMIRNENILKEVNGECLSLTVKRRELRTLGHSIRRGRNTLVERLSIFSPDNKNLVKDDHG